MATTLKLRRGTTAQHSTFTGAVGEVTADTDKDTLVVHDGVTAGGFPLAKENNATLTGSVTFSNGTANGVAYLNGSKALTTGSALVFDGTNLGVGGLTNPGSYSRYIEVAGTDAAVFVRDTDTAGAWGALTQSGSSSYLINNQGDWRFWASGSESMRLTSTGLGIGTTSPAVPLHVNNASSSACRIYLQNTGNTAAGYTQIWSQNNDLAFNAGNAERLRISSSGDVGIGTSSPASKLNIVDASNTVNVRLESGSVVGQFFSSTTGGGVFLDANSSHPLVFRTAATERARIDLDGKLLVGVTSASWSGITDPYFQVGTSGSISVYSNTTGYSIRLYSTSRGLEFDNNSTARDYYFTKSSGGSYANTYAASFTVSSDYRLKENIVPLSDALSRVSQLKPSRFNYKSDIETKMPFGEQTVDGFIAHEVADVVPEAVHGEKDAVYEDGRIQPQGLDASKLIPLLTAAIQEQQAIIEQLKADVAALKGN